MPINADGIFLDTLASDPGSPAEGQLWYNTTAQKLMLRLSGSSVVVASSAASGVFGNDFQQVAVDASTSTTSSTPQTRVTLTTGDLTGTYRVGYCAETSAGAANKNVQVRLYNNTDAVVLCTSLHRDSAASLTCSNAGFAYVTFTGSSKTFLIQYSSPDNSTSAYIQNARIELWRVS
jgi:hypothetical protein